MINLFRNDEEPVCCFDCGATIQTGQVMGRANGNDICGPCAGDRSGAGSPRLMLDCEDDISIPLEGTVS